MALSAVGAVNIVVTLYSSIIRQKVLASGVPTGLPVSMVKSILPPSRLPQLTFEQNGGRAS
jgi:hypothetical protein